LGRISVEVSHGKVHARDCEECEGREGRIDRFERRITIEGGVPQDLEAKVVEIADKSSAGVWIDGWDFGDGPSYTVWCRALWVQSIDRVFIAQHKSWMRKDAEEIAKDMKPILEMRAPDYMVGDIAGTIKAGRVVAGRRSEPNRTWMNSLEEHGIKVHPQSLVVSAAVSHLRDYLKRGDLLLAPPACQRDPGLIDAPCAEEVLQMYHYEVSSRKGGDPKLSKGPESHLADAMLHIFRRIWMIGKNL
jgi:hypothetical protein